MRENLTIAFPHADEAALQDIMRRYYTNFAQVLVEIVKSVRLPPDEIRRRVRVPGRKQRRTITLVTTLLDRRRYPARQIVELAAARWQAETDLRHLKITLKLDVLRCKTVTGIVKELAAMILVYNLVRAVMLRAALVGLALVERPRASGRPRGCAHDRRAALGAARSECALI